MDSFCGSKHAVLIPKRCALSKNKFTTFLKIGNDIKYLVYFNLFCVEAGVEINLATWHVKEQVVTDNTLSSVNIENVLSMLFL